MPISRTRRSNTTSIKVGERTPVTTVFTGTLIRSMQQTTTGTDTPLYYEFHFGISTFTHDSSGVLYTEIPRPLNLPLVDATSLKLERCSFEFLIAVPYDSLGSSIDSHITLLQDFANQDRTVQFSNVHSALAVKPWYIDSITFQITRVNESGQATAATCNMSLVESIERTERFAKLPKFTYKIPSGSSLGGPNIGTPDTGIGVSGNIIQIESLGRGGLVVATTETPHGLKSGTFVIIAFLEALIPSNIIALATPNKPYEIAVSAITPTKFSYIKTIETGDTPVTFVAPYSIVSGRATYTVTASVPKQKLFIGSRDTAVTQNKYVEKTTKQEQDNIVALEATDLTTSIDGVIITAEAMAQIKKYLYELKFSETELYKREIGNTESAAYKKAVSYLVNIVKYGQDPRKVSLTEIVRNIG